MPSPKSHRRGDQEVMKNGRKGRVLCERASSFHGKSSTCGGEMTTAVLPRPRTVPELLMSSSGSGRRDFPAPDVSSFRPLKMTKLLLNVTIQRSSGAVQVLMSPENTVEDLIAAAVKQYAKEGRRPILPSADPSGFDLHYSQFSLESLKREEKLMALGSRNFFLCQKKKAVNEGGLTAASSSSSTCSSSSSSCSNGSSRCSKEAADKVTRTGLPWLKFMDFLL